MDEPNLAICILDMRRVERFGNYCKGRGFRSRQQRTWKLPFWNRRCGSSAPRGSLAMKEMQTVTRWTC